MHIQEVGHAQIGHLGQHGRVVPKGLCPCSVTRGLKVGLFYVLAPLSETTLSISFAWSIFLLPESCLKLLNLSVGRRINTAHRVPEVYNMCHNMLHKNIFRDVQKDGN